MPSFSSPSSIRVASQDHALRLKVTHNFVHGTPSEAGRSIKGRLPKELDVLWLSDLTISISGSYNGHQIPPLDITRSGLVHHLQTRLKANADRLGLNNVSRPFVDDADGLSKCWKNHLSSLLASDPVFQVTLTPSRPLPRTSRPHVNLVSLHLAYLCTTVAECSDVVNLSHSVEEANPFSPILFLPAELLLNRVTEQFLINHLVGRYPLIFGPWSKRLDLEMQYFPSIGHSILDIMSRSKNHMFLSKCKRLIKIARSHHMFVLESCTAALSCCAGDAASESSEEEMGNYSVLPVLTDEQILCESMEQLFRVGVPRRRFKPIATLQIVQDDDDSLLPCLPDARTDDEASWVELPEITTSPCALVPDSHQTSPEDTDVFAHEGWPEDGMRCLHGATTSPCEREFDAQSDESLISASIPPANIATYSPQACSYALYHHLDVNDREPDPAASGLRYDASSSAHLEDPGTSALFVNSPSHGHHYSGKYEQLMQELGTCQVGPGSFETLDSSSECDKVGDSNSIWVDLDEDTDASVQLRQSLDAAALTMFDVDLDWDDGVVEV